jgi:hypothetical protein
LAAQAPNAPIPAAFGGVGGAARRATLLPRADAALHGRVLGGLEGLRWIAEHAPVVSGFPIPEALISIEAIAVRQR